MSLDKLKWGRYRVKHYDFIVYFFPSYNEGRYKFKSSLKVWRHHDITKRALAPGLDNQGKGMNSYAFDNMALGESFNFFELWFAYLKMKIIINPYNVLLEVR